jgi:hypothetical protein
VKIVSVLVNRSRVRRLTGLLAEIHERDGVISAAKLFFKLIGRKFPILWRQLTTAPRASAISRHVEAERARSGRPYVAVAVTGGVGDHVVIARFLRDLCAAVGDIGFDVFSPTPEQAAWVFAAVPGFICSYHDILFERLLPEYDAGFRANQTIVVYREALCWSRLRNMPELVRVIDNLIRARAKVDVFIDRHPFLDNFLARTALFAERTRRDFLHAMADIPYGGDSMAIPADTVVADRLGLESHCYVTVHNGFDTGFVITGRRATKCYPHFDAVVAILKRSVPHLTFVQVGVGTSEPIAECDINLIGKTTLPEVAGILAKSAFHIDNESGLVHLARCYGVTAGVVFGPTPAGYFAYPDNVSIEPPVCGNCWWMTRTWMDSCAKGYAAPRCMTEQEPALVADRILAAMDSLGLTSAPGNDVNAATPAAHNQEDRLKPGGLGERALTGESLAQNVTRLVPLPKR